MHAEQIRLVQASFAHVAPIADAAATLFYNRLFELDPALRSLFADDLSGQKAKLMHALTLVVKGLSNLDKLAPTVAQLGQRHAVYGVRPEHYATVGAALLWTLEQGLGDHYTADVARAWTAAYTLLADVMQQAASTAQAPA